jgi:predicted RNA-binding protein with PIN domain
MDKVMPSKTTTKSKVTTGKVTDPLTRLQSAVDRTANLADTMLTVMEEEMKGLSKKDQQWKQMFGPSGPISSLHKLVQILDKLGDQVEQMQKLTAHGKSATAEPISKEDIRLLEDWLKQR